MAYDDDHADDDDDGDDHDARSHCQSKALLFDALKKTMLREFAKKKNYIVAVYITYIHTFLARFKVCFSTENEDDCQPVTVFVEGCKMPVTAIALRREFKKFTFIVWRGVLQLTSSVN
ncbi:hypothetical protein GQX74_002344 [Glossina fuscipes]|nr:hypothetical protein GQX74_002344 [Glossina fuscipes]